MDFTNIDWRKGSAGDASPADQGRDIEADFHHDSPDGTREKQRWFIECKHHARPIAPKDIAGLLSWATSERPDRVLIICSSVLSNPCKNHLQKYEQENRPPFRIVWWENAKLSLLSAPFTDLLNKYGLISRQPCLELLHPAHVEYLKLTGPNTLQQLFDALERLEPKRREEVLGLTLYGVIKPRYKPTPPGYKGTIGELMLDRVHYHAFKDKCRVLTDLVEEHFLVSAIVSGCLRGLFHRGDMTSVGALMSRYDGVAEEFEMDLKTGHGDSEMLRKMVADMKRFKKTAKSEARKAYAIYVQFCETVLCELNSADSFAPFRPTISTFQERRSKSSARKS